MGDMQQKVYLFKAATEEDSGNPTASSGLLLQQPHHLKQQNNAGEQQKSTNDDDDTATLANHGLDISTRPSFSTTATTLIQQQEEGKGTTTTTPTDHTVITPTASKDRFITHLHSLQIESQLVPVLIFEYSNLDTLWRHLKQPDRHAGIVLTSPRCVHSITEAIKAYDTSRSQDYSGGEWENGLRNEWESKYIFCVGPSTVSTARLVFPSLKTEMVITGLESHAESLANKIIQVNAETAFNADLLYPCGVLRRDVLLNKLNDKEIACSQCIVYESVMNPSLEDMLHFVGEELKNFQSCQIETVLCFFSPSGVKNVFQYLDRNIVEHSKTNIVAIGPTTKTALDDCFVAKGISKLVYQCKTPTPESLIDVMQSIKANVL